MNFLKRKKQPWLRLKFGQPFALPKEIKTIADHKRLFASSKDQGEIVLFEYLEEKPPLLNEIGMGAKIVNYHVEKSHKHRSGDNNRSDLKKVEEEEKQAHIIGHNVNIKKTDDEDLYPLLGRKSLKENSTTQVLWTNLSRAKVKKQR